MQPYKCNSQYVFSTSFRWVGIKPGLWTLDWTVDWTMDWTVDWTMDWIMNSILYLIVFYFCHLKKTMDVRLPNEQGIGITIGTDICIAFSKTGWLV